MHGSIPIVLSLTILCNHFFYVVPAARRDADRSPAHYWRVALQQALIVFVCFGVAYGALTACRLVLLNAIVGVGWQQYAVSLGLRLGNEIPGRAIGLEDDHSEVVGRAISTVLRRVHAIDMGVVRCAGGMDLYPLPPSSRVLASRQCRGRPPRRFVDCRAGRRGRADVVPPVPPAHVHPCPVCRADGGRPCRVRSGRRGTRPAVLYGERRQGRIAGRLPRAALRRASPLRICWKATVSVVTSARLVQQPVVDVVACAPVGLQSDGKADGLIELSLRSTQASPPLALAGVRPRRSARHTFGWSAQARRGGGKRARGLYPRHHSASEQRADQSARRKHYGSAATRDTVGPFLSGRLRYAEFSLRAARRGCVLPVEESASSANTR